MNIRTTYITLLLTLFLAAFSVAGHAQEEATDLDKLPVDSLIVPTTTALSAETDTLAALKDTLVAAKDTVAEERRDTVETINGSLIEEPVKAETVAADSVKKVKTKRDWTTWKPNPKRAMWLALVFPGGGQIYNRKYWKLPIFYGGFVGCAYAWSWNNQMYTDYKQAYLDIMDDDDSTHSYDQFLHLGSQITSSNLSRYQTLFSKRKDRFRRYRDLSFFCIIAVYALSVIDAYVDASLSEFDISEDLSMHIEPAYINSGMYNNPVKGGGMGVQCSLSF